MAYNFYPTAWVNDSQNWMYFEEFFTPEDLKWIEENVQEIDPKEATTFSGNTKGRSSKVRWIPQNEKWEWLYNSLMNLSKNANESLWGFDLKSAPEEIQYTEYHSDENGHYGWHQDIGPDIASSRKVSITVQLSSPEEYEGGNLQISRGGLGDNSGYDMPKGKGTVVIFPSYMMHRVTPVTSGIRKSFVLWVGGEHYK